MTEEAVKEKESGNEFFKNNQFKEALHCYDRALQTCASGDKRTKAVLFRNRAAVHLKLCNYLQAEEDSTSALNLFSEDSKALFRRAQAREKMDNLSAAFNDAKMALKIEPKNKAVIAYLQHLAVVIQEKQNEATSTETRVSQMMSLCFEQKGDAGKREQAMNNLIVLVRDGAGAEMVMSKDGVQKVLKVVLMDPNTEMAVAGLRVLLELMKHEKLRLSVLKLVSVETFINFLNRKEAVVTDIATLLVQDCFNSLAGMDPKEQKKPDEQLVKEHQIILTDILFELKQMLVRTEVFASARNAVIRLLMKNLIHMDNGLPRGWSWRFIEDDGLVNLLKVACNIPEQCYLPVTKETPEHLAVCLSRLYDDMVFDNYRARFKEITSEFLKQRMEDLNDVSKVEICALITVLLLGPYDVGFALISTPEMSALMLTMAQSSIFLHQSVALDAIVQALSKRDRCMEIIRQGVPVLRKLYASSNDLIQVKALVGLCKCASCSGTDISMRPFGEESLLKLAKVCKKLLLAEQRDIEIKRYAAEALSYLTLDADVKEFVTENLPLIHSLMGLAKVVGQLCVFSVGSILVNLMNAYDKQQAEPELVKLAKFSKHHVPEKHPKDADEFVDRRIDVLANAGAASACVALSHTTSPSCRELLSRALFTLCQNEVHRGIVVQEGGGKVLVKLAADNSDKGKMHAAQAIAKIAITINPEIAFPGQRCHEIVRPLATLLHLESSALQNYEALLALTNLASLSESIRQKMFKEKLLPMIEEYWYMQNQPELRAAAAELLLNLLYCEEFFKSVASPGTDRLKLWVLYTADDDDRLASASAGGLAVLTQDDSVCLRIIKEVSSWVDVLKEAAMRENAEIQYRVLMVIANMMRSSIHVAAEIVASELLPVLIAVTKLRDERRRKGIEQATIALKAAEKFELIRPTDREIYERTTGISTILEQ